MRHCHLPDPDVTNGGDYGVIEFDYSDRFAGIAESVDGERDVVHIVSEDAIGMRYEIHMPKKMLEAVCLGYMASRKALA